MYCGKCGAENTDSARFCLVCGQMLAPAPEPISPPPVPNEPVAVELPVKPKRSRKKWVILLVVAVLVVALGAAAAYMLLNKNTPRNVIYTAMDAMTEEDGETLFELLPEDLREEVYGNRTQQREATNELEEYMEYVHDYYSKTFGEYTIEYEVIHVEKLTGDTLEDLQDVYDDEFDCQVSAAKEVTVKVVVEADDIRYVTTEVLTVVKVDGTWYLAYENIY